MSDKSQHRTVRAHSSERRQFLRKVGLAGTSAAAAAALPGIVAAAPESAAAVTEAGPAGYQDSAHVRNYYRLASE